MSLGRYVLGAACILIVLASLALAAVNGRRRWLADWTGAPARLAEIVIGIATLVAILELLGTVGWFELAPIVAACAAAGGASLMLTPGGRRPSPPPRRTAGLAAAGIAVAVTVAVAAEWTGPTLQAYDVGIRTFDSVWYHLPWAASFAQTGHVAPLRFTDIEYLTAFYPATAEMLHGLGIVLLGHDTLSPLLNLIWAMLVLFAAWCVGRARGAGAAATAGVAVVLATPMMNSSQAGSAANDIVGMFFLLASVALVLAGDGRPPANVLAAVAAGLAVGTKLSMVAPALALDGRGDRDRSARPARDDCGRVARGRWCSPAATGTRATSIAVGNPLPWTSLGILPTPAPPLQQHTGFAVAHYLTSSAAWKGFFEPGLAAGLARWWTVILAFAVVGPVLCLLPGAGRTVRMLGLVALVSLAAYLITPETAAGPAGDPAGFAFNLRYAAPALALCFAVLPLAPAFDGPGRQSALVVALAAVLLATVTKGSLWPHRHVLGIVLVAAALSVAGLALVAMSGRARARPDGVGGGATAPGGCSGRIWLAAALPARAIPVQPGGLVSLACVGFLQDGASRPRGRGGHLRRLLLVPAVGARRLKPRAVRRRTRPPRLVQSDRHLSPVARGAQRGALPSTWSRPRRATPGTPSALRRRPNPDGPARTGPPSWSSAAGPRGSRSRCTGSGAGCTRAPARPRAVRRAGL